MERSHQNATAEEIRHKEGSLRFMFSRAHREALSPDDEDEIEETNHAIDNLFKEILEDAEHGSHEAKVVIGNLVVDKDDDIYNHTIELLIGSRYKLDNSVIDELLALAYSSREQRQQSSPNDQSS